jgi:hypothetical protein
VVADLKLDLNTFNAPGLTSDDLRHADTYKRAVRQPQLADCPLGPQVHIHIAAAATSSFRF